ncbi:eukaryotic translation initiation factor 4 gamma 3-like [Contarinia nasturtii]|uniref:eukaryotic translation initiation factor 4 gamma 3-like n=1 Tax=Contarinia nasturtii TaxID=265458 RepID=UPI0012D43738|nr:eukaryotic translation initiation factor 4 gamma 3-like [Contarinia nasturtii]
MSPLAPQVSSTLALLNGSKNEEPKIIDTEKHVYSVTDLIEMRHDRSQAPNLNNSNLLALITRGEPGAPKSKFTNMISFNHRPIVRHHNGSFMSNGSSFNGERQRHSIRDRGHTNGTHNGVHIRMSIKSDVKLKEAENAWKPSFLQKNDKNDDGEAEELYKQARSILNKLTAQNFGILSEQFQSLKIDTKEKLVGVINLVFNKAVNEPSFSEGYAKLSQYLSHCSQQIDSSLTERAYFKRTLINKCQVEFEQHVANKNTTEAALAPLMAKMKVCQEQNDQNGIKEIKTQITEEESALRRRLVSTVRFIGELYKLDMLTTNIMNVCIHALIREAAPNQSNTSQANEKLECVCKLLTTVGGKLEQRSADNVQNLDLTVYMNQLKRIADNKIRNFKTTTRIRFMIMDVIELRNNQWKPKKTIAQISQ